MAAAAAPSGGADEPAAGVFVKRAGDARARFAEVAIFATDTITRLAERAALKLAWGTTAAHVELFLVKPAGGGEHASATPTQAQIDAVLADERNAPGEGVPLALAGIAAGAWVVARLLDPPETVLTARGRRGGAMSDARDFEALARAGGARDFLASVAARARTRFALRIANALTEQSPADAARVYWDAEQLPSTTTVHAFKLGGFHANGPLCEGSELTIVYRGTRSYVAKGVRASDAQQRLGALRDAMLQATAAGAPAPRHVAPFELLTSPAGRIYAIMPRYVDSLERVPPLDNPEAVAALWEHASAALSDLHALGFAHGNVKPANVCLDDGGGLWLIDLDSAAQFGAATQTTLEYLPIDERGVRVLASARADWWALAMTLAEKA